MKLYKWKAFYQDVKLIGIVFAIDVDNAVIIVNKRLSDYGYKQEDIKKLKCEEIKNNPSYSSFHIICKRKINKKKRK